MFGYDALHLARAQFAFTVAFHIIFPAFSIGLASYLAVLSVAAAIGALIAGPLIDAFGPRWATAIGGTGGLIAATSALVWLVSVRSYRLSWNRNRRWRIRFAPEPEAGF